jgi:hypothetical protein
VADGQQNYVLVWMLGVFATGLIQQYCDGSTGGLVATGCKGGVLFDSICWRSFHEKAQQCISVTQIWWHVNMHTLAVVHIRMELHPACCSICSSAAASQFAVRMSGLHDEVLHMGVASDALCMSAAGENAAGNTVTANDPNELRPGMKYA